MPSAYAGRRFNQPSEAILSFTGPGLFTQSVQQHLQAGPDSGLVQAGINFQDSLRYPESAQIMQLATPHYKHCRDRVILNSPAEDAHQRGLSAQRAGDLSALPSPTKRLCGWNRAGCAASTTLAAW